MTRTRTMICAAFDEPETAVRTARALSEAGIAREAVEVFLPRPPDPSALAPEERRTLMPLFSVLGGIAGATVGGGLTVLTQQRWPLETGAMPPFTFWTSGIVIYELTMLGAILATVGTFLASARLLRRRVPIAELAAASDRAVVFVAPGGDRPAAELVERLAALGAMDIRVLERSA